MSKFSKALKDHPASMRICLARSAASSKMPYFASGLQSLIVREQELAPQGKPTMGVTAGGHLLVDQRFLEKLNVDEASTVLLHEWLHIYLRHTERFDAMVEQGSLADSGEDRGLWNDAADMEINDDLKEARCVFPGKKIIGAVFPEAFGLPEHKTAEWYALQLKQKQGYEPRRQAGAEGEGVPACGSAAGNPLEGEPAAGDSDARDGIEQDMIRRSAAEEVKAHQRSRGQGSVPRGISLAADQLLEPPKIPWGQLLQSEVSSALRYVAGSADYTYSVRARQQSALEWAFGVEAAPVLPGMHEPVAKIALVIDTSGSMTYELKTVCSEAQGILSAMGGASLTVVACDAEVHELREVLSVEEVQASLKGGGGTDFRPAFDALKQLPKHRRPDVVVFGTDGYGSYPDEEPPWKHVWLCCSGSIAADWGTVVEAEPEQAAA